MAVWTGPSSPGATRSDQAARSWPTPGTGSTSPGAAPGRPAGCAPHRSGASPPTGWSLRHGRQRLGVDRRLVDPPPPRRRPSACCVPANPRGGDRAHSYDPAQPQFRVGRKVIKGGSHLCADSYCRRYRPAARRPQMIDTGMSHIGFRCVWRASPCGRPGDLMTTTSALPSWRPGTDPGRGAAVPQRCRTLPVGARVACFDNDGTLWCERPSYVQFDFFVDALRSADSTRSRDFGNVPSSPPAER